MESPGSSQLITSLVEKLARKRRCDTSTCGGAMLFVVMTAASVDHESVKGLVKLVTWRASVDGKRIQSRTCRLCEPFASFPAREASVQHNVSIWGLDAIKSRLYSATGFAPAKRSSGLLFCVQRLVNGAMHFLSLRLSQ